MMAMGAVISSMSVVPGPVTVRIRLRIAIIRSPVIPIRIIIVGSRISIIAAWESKTDASHSRKSARDLSIGTLYGNESQPAYRQSNQEKLFHKISLSYSLVCEGRNLSRDFLRR